MQTTHLKAKLTLPHGHLQSPGRLSWGAAGRLDEGNLNLTLRLSATLAPDWSLDLQGTKPELTTCSDLSPGSQSRSACAA